LPTRLSPSRSRIEQSTRPAILSRSRDALVSVSSSVARPSKQRQSRFLPSSSRIVVFVVSSHHRLIVAASFRLHFDAFLIK
jgi:hypothetical protein